MNINFDEKLEIHELLSWAACAYDERQIGILEHFLRLRGR